jgi:hypothetical protein
VCSRTCSPFRLRTRARVPRTNDQGFRGSQPPHLISSSSTHSSPSMPPHLISSSSTHSSFPSMPPHLISSSSTHSFPSMPPHLISSSSTHSFPSQPPHLISSSSTHSFPSMPPHLISSRASRHLVIASHAEIKCAVARLLPSCVFTQPTAEDMRAMRHGSRLHCQTCCQLGECRIKRKDWYGRVWSLQKLGECECVSAVPGYPGSVN